MEGSQRRSVIICLYFHRLTLAAMLKLTKEGQGEQQRGQFKYLAKRLCVHALFLSVYSRAEPLSKFFSSHVTLLQEYQNNPLLAKLCSVVFFSSTLIFCYLAFYLLCPLLLPCMSSLFLVSADLLFCQHTLPAILTSSRRTHILLCLDPSQP